jgi:hypothetical protein
MGIPSPTPHTNHSSRTLMKSLNFLTMNTALGGLLSILPSKEQEEDRKLAEATLLGQLIMYMQRLVQRLHDLERLYANAMDVLAGEAVVPSQTLSRLGPDGRKGREMVYPQDRFVLVNAGEDLWSLLDSEFTRKEIIDEIVEENYRSIGVTGEAIWEQRGGREMSRGITALDITTQYYRLRRDPLKTIFVIPAHEAHPGTKVTREIEKQPTVVSVVKPVWPERASMWEMKHRGDLEDLKRIKVEWKELRQEVEWLREEKKVLVSESKERAGEARLASKKMWEEKEKVKETLNKPENVLQKEAVDDRMKAEEEKKEAEGVKEQAHEELVKAMRAKEEADKRHKELNDSAAELKKREDAFVTQQKQRIEMEQKMLEEKEAYVEDLDEYDGGVAQELHKKLQAVWAKQIAETQVILDYLEKKTVDVDTGAVPGPNDLKNARKKAKQMVNDATKDIRQVRTTPLSPPGTNRTGSEPHSSPEQMRRKGASTRKEVSFEVQDDEDENMDADENERMEMRV